MSCLTIEKFQIEKKMEVNPMKIYANDIPKIFWKYFDLYRRKKITLAQYVEMTGLTHLEIRTFLNTIDEKKSKIR